MRILLAADGSKYTGRAVDYLIKHGERFGPSQQLVLVHVRMPIPGRAAAALSHSIVEKYYAQETRKALAAARRKLDRASLAYTVVGLLGDAGTEIAAFARKGRFDMVVMGSHGHGMLASLVMGSSASKVLAQCKVPVLLIR